MQTHAAHFWREGIFHRLPTRGLIGAVPGHELPLISHFALLQRYLPVSKFGNLTKVLMWPMGYEAQTCPSVQVDSISPHLRTTMAEAWLRPATSCVLALARWFRGWGGLLRRGRQGVPGRRRAGSLAGRCPWS